MRNRHGTTGKFAPGKSLGTYRGAMTHDPSTETIKTALHSDMNPSRKVVAAHDGVQSVSTVTGRKPSAHDCADGGCNKATNADFNDHAAGTTQAAKLTAGQLVGSGVKLS